MIKDHNKISALQYFYFYINHILVDVPLNHSTILIVSPSCFNIEIMKKKLITYCIILV